jgi:hypothetical protein
MSQSAQVTSVEAVRDFRGSLLVFCEEVRQALAAIQLEAHHTIEWLLRDQLSRWQRAMRDRHEEVVQAKAELSRKQISKTVGGQRPDCAEEVKAVRRAQERLREAEEKVASCKQWGGHLLPRALDEFRGPAQQLAGLVQGQPPHMVAFLESALAHLDSYVQRVAPPGQRPAAAPAAGEKKAPAPTSEVPPAEPNP